MNSTRLATALAVLAGIGTLDSMVRAEASSSWLDSRQPLLLAKATKEEKETKKGDGKQEKRKEETKREKEKSDNKREKRKRETKRETGREKSDGISTIQGTLAVEAGAEGATRVTVTGEGDKTYVLRIPEAALPKAQQLAGKWVMVKGRVRTRDGESLVDRIQACRAVPKPKSERTFDAENPPVDAE
jgi:hypothetical protein